MLYIIGLADSVDSQFPEWKGITVYRPFEEPVLSERILAHDILEDGLVLFLIDLPRCPNIFQSLYRGS